jgi:hypothetical protein
MRVFKIVLLYPLMFVLTAAIAAVVGVIAFLACLIDLPYEIAVGLVDDDEPKGRDGSNDLPVYDDSESRMA